MLDQTIREQVEIHGHVLLREIELSQVTKVARLFGEITADIRSPDPYRRISPQALDSAKPNTLSSRYGLGTFPFHTDVAHWRAPADFVLLFCDNPGSGNRPTELIDTRPWPITAEFHHALRSDLWKTGYRFPRFCTVGTEVDGVLNWRYDTGCMRPAGRKSSELQTKIDALISSSSPARLSWATNSLLVIDNKRMLHGRGRAAAPDQDRKLIRILVGGIQ
ncbi:TauD/TfdA family dioxygenase [Litchfieldella qijiaojingensis]|uniref:TauD/TfdA family dioxygenase n=1 Tax=Litchfieldella qijiaojingensis TaxID=980347 RepID=UPI001674AA07